MSGERDGVLFSLSLAPGSTWRVRGGCKWVSKFARGGINLSSRPRGFGTLTRGLGLYWLGFFFYRSWSVLIVSLQV